MHGLVHRHEEGVELALTHEAIEIGEHCFALRAVSVVGVTAPRAK
jgi:hypothetical protein